EFQWVDPYHGENPWPHSLNLGIGAGPMALLPWNLIIFDAFNKEAMSSKKGKVQELIQEKLLMERKVFLWGQVDDDSAKHVIDHLLYLDLQDNKEIQLIINSPGGYVTSGFAIYDTIKQIK